MAAQQTPAAGPREEEEEEKEGLWAVPDPKNGICATADTSLLIPPSRLSRPGLGISWAPWGKDEKLSGEEAGRKRETGE